MDLLSAVLLIAGILAIIFGIKQMAQDGISLIALLSTLPGFGIIFIFIQRQKKLELPLIDLKLFSNARFNAALGALFIGIFSWSGMFLFVGQYLQSVLGLGSFEAGLWMLPGALGSVVLCMLAPIALKHFSRGVVITAGLLLLTTGIASLSLLTDNGLPLLVVAMVLMSAGCGLTVTVGIDLVLASAPAQKAGAAAGLSETSTGFGGALGVAILGSVWNTLYRHDMDNSTGSAVSRDTIGGAIAEAHRLNDTGLLAQAKQAFIHSLHITSFLSACIIFVVAVLVAIKFSR
ncbi:Na+/melibiose symporter-like transporter [Dyadobacter arcticus]|uniref:Na+/melibiose symporter-like transporter n=2 Tax=Dyadobacter arcticus TaxID=1078754 RepID=A0ABX0UUD9_9BACT|nr:Na+/melibiose symporter-like transporter [Dyadobacter arcticus]